MLSSLLKSRFQVAAHPARVRRAGARNVREKESRGEQQRQRAAAESSREERRGESGREQGRIGGRRRCGATVAAGVCRRGGVRALCALIPPGVLSHPTRLSSVNLCCSDPGDAQEQSLKVERLRCVF